MSHSPKTHGARAVAAMAYTGALAMSGLTACAAGPADTSDDRYVIGIEPDSTEQAVLGEVYRVVLESVGQPTVVRQVPEAAEESAIDLVQSGAADMAITCTGTLLEHINPQQADQAVEESKVAGGDVDRNDNSFSDDVYEYAVGNFPGGVMTVDPSPAQGCAADGETAGEGDLPTNVIPVFAKTDLNRGQVYRLNYVSRLLRTDEVADMVDDVEAGEPVNKVVTDWMLQRTKIAVNPQSEEDGETGDSDSVLDQPPV